MGLIDLLVRAASSRAHVLVAEAPGAFRERVALERALDRRGWCRVDSVADADVLAVVGEPGEDLANVVEQVWAQLSEPRVRVHVSAVADVERVLDQAREQLAGDTRRLTEPELRPGFTPSNEPAEADHGEHEDHAGHQDHGGHEDHGGDGGHDHGAMMPDGIALAEGAEDRDGLEMDVLHLPLGPVLQHWPAGLVLRVALHGDVVAEVEVEQLSNAATTTPTSDDATTQAARLLDAAAAVLSLAGLPAQAARARRLRDRCLDGDLPDGTEVAELCTRVGRTRTLRWVLDGLGITGRQGGTELLNDRLADLFERARAALDGEATRHVTFGPRALRELVRGQELAAVRLWVAAAMPDLTEHGSEASRHG